MLFRYFLLFLGLSHAAILRSKDLQMNITELLTLKGLVKTQLVDKKWIGIEKAFERINPNAGLFVNKQTNELVLETKKNSWTQIELVENLKMCPNIQNLIEKKNWDEVFLELISNKMSNRRYFDISQQTILQQTILRDKFCEALANVVNGDAVHALMETNLPGTPGTCAADFGHVKYSSPVCTTHLLEIFLKRSDTNPNVKNALGQTLLHTLADDFDWRGGGDDYISGDIIDILLKYGAEIDPIDNNSMTPLMIASENPNVNVVKALLTRGANPNLRNKHNQTCLHIAMQEHSTHYVVDEMLMMQEYNFVKHKPEIDAPDNEMRTALMIAAKNADEAQVHFLLGRGASPNLRDKDGKTAVDHAEEQLFSGRWPFTYDSLEYIMLPELYKARDKWKKKLKQIKRKREKLLPKQNLKIMSED